MMRFANANEGALELIFNTQPDLVRIASEMQILWVTPDRLSLAAQRMEIATKAMHLLISTTSSLWIRLWWILNETAWNKFPQKRLGCRTHLCSASEYMNQMNRRRWVEIRFMHLFAGFLAHAILTYEFHFWLFEFFTGITDAPVSPDFDAQAVPALER